MIYSACGMGGPFENEDDADKMRAQLALNGYSDIPWLKLVAQGE